MVDIAVIHIVIAAQMGRQTSHKLHINIQLININYQGDMSLTIH